MILNIYDGSNEQIKIPSCSVVSIKSLATAQIEVESRARYQQNPAHLANERYYEKNVFIVQTYEALY